MPISEQIPHLTHAVFDSLLQSNTSLRSFLFPDRTINFDGLGLRSIESDTFVHHHLPVTTIVLSSNQLSYLPNNVFRPFYSTLLNLNLQQNQFRSLAENYFLRRLEQLRTLDLSKNQLKEICKQDFTGLRRLETLILRENRLASLPDGGFNRCRTITTLDLSDNQLGSLDARAFDSLYRLKILLLSNNPLGKRALTHPLMKPMRNLEYLDLENTQLDDLPPYLFISNERLQSVKLRRNRFQTNGIDDRPRLQRTFCRARSLLEIDLVGTQLQTLDVCTYDQLPSLRRLYLMNNPLDCTCDLFYLKYGDIYRVLLTDGNGIDRTRTNIDTYLDRWIARPELRRHLEIAHARGDFHRLPIELSLFARCATPHQWNGREINNITGVYELCQQRWSRIEQECGRYCQSDIEVRVSPTVVNTMSTASRPDDLRVLRCYSLLCLLALLLSL